MSITLDDYLNNLDVSAVGVFTLSEADETKKITGFLSKFSGLFSKIKDKKAAKDNLKKIENSKQTKRFEKILKDNISPNGSFNKVAAKNKIIKEFKDGAENTLEDNPALITTVFAAIIEWVLFSVRTNGMFPVHLFASLLTIFMKMPEAALVRIITKTSKSQEAITKELEKDQQYAQLSVVTILTSILNFFFMVGFISLTTPSAVAVLTISSLLLIITSIVRLLYGVFIGVKRNNWKQYEKAVKAKLGETIYHTNNDYIESSIFISSLREDITNKCKTETSKIFIESEASDYEILYLTIEGVFPDSSSGDCQLLIDIINTELDINLLSIEDVGLSTKGITPDIIIETIFNDNLFNKSFLTEANLLEANVNMAHLQKLFKEMKQAKKDFVASHPDRGGDLEASKIAGAKFQDAKQRYETYKDSGVDPGGESYSKPKDDDFGGTNYGDYSDYAAQQNWFNTFIDKVWNFSPKAIVLKILRNIYGAEKLAKATAMSPALAGGIIVMGGTVVAALFSWASYKAYTRLFSKAAKACKGKGDSKSKSICMQKFEINALTARKIDLTRVVKFCNKLRLKREQKDCELSLTGKIKDLNDDIKTAKGILTSLEKAA